MKIQPYVQKLQSSGTYKDFQQKYKDAFLVAGFFVIDFETGRNLHQIDYYVPSKKKFAAFTLDKSVEMQLLKSLDKKAPEKLDINAQIDLDALQGIILDEMKNRNITQTIKKMIAVLQNRHGKKVWNVNCVLSGMDILKVHVEDNSKTILKMERSSILDYVKKLPAPAAVAGGAQAGQVGQASSESQGAVQVAPRAAPTKEELKRQIEQLDKVKSLLKKEEVELEKQEAIENEKNNAVKSSKKGKKGRK